MVCITLFDGFGCHGHACVAMPETSINMPTQAWAWHRYLCRTISRLQKTRLCQGNEWVGQGNEWVAGGRSEAKPQCAAPWGTAARHPASLLNAISLLALRRRGADGHLFVKSFSAGKFSFETALCTFNGKSL